jgi:uncharacterized protein YdeI (YjbR/CyaY-like superfamily)
MSAKAPEGPSITFFETPSDFRKWLEKHHATEQELWVGFYKKDSGKPSITWPESVDEALCFGWIDGIRKRVDEASYKIRFTPRRRGSIWSAVNLKRAQELIETGRMRPAGLRAFENRKEDNERRYSYEQQGAKLSGEYEQKLKAHPQAWSFFQAQPPRYRKMAGWFVMSAKKEETRLRRLDRLIADSARGQTLSPMASGKKPDARR